MGFQDPSSADEVHPDAAQRYGVVASTEWSVDDSGPTLDYILRYPPPTEDDPTSPDFVATTAAAALAGPDMHAVLEVEVVEAGGARRGVSVMEQLRQRALMGSSDEDDGEKWRSMDIPALLMSRHHASALCSLSSSDDDTSAVPDFADLTRAHEAELAAQAAAEHVPPELQHLARAAGLLRYLGGRVQAAGGTLGQKPSARLPPTRFDGLLPEPLTAEQLEAAVQTLTITNVDPEGGLASSVADSRDSCVEDARARGTVGTDPDSGSVTDTGSTTGADAFDDGSGLDVITASKPSKPAVAAAAAALAEEGIDWLSPSPSTPGAPTAAAAPSATEAGSLPVALASTRAAAEPAALRPPAGRPAESPAAPAHPLPSLEAVAAAAAVIAAVRQATGPPAEPKVGDEDRSVQLRRPPHGPRHAGAMNAVLQMQVAEAVAREAAEAEMHVVRHTDVARPEAVAPDSHVPVAPAAVAGEFITSKNASALMAGEAAGAAAAVVGELAAAGGRVAADAAAAELTAEIRRAVWGEGGYPYSPALCTEDLAEDIKEVIFEQQEEAKWGFDGVLLP